MVVKEAECEEQRSEKLLPPSSFSFADLAVSVETPRLGEKGSLHVAYKHETSVNIGAWAHRVTPPWFRTIHGARC